MDYRTQLRYGLSTQLQYIVLRGLQALPFRPSVVPMFKPLGVFHVSWPVTALYSEIFREVSYKPRIRLPAAPNIIDAGAHMGLASIYLLTCFPQATLTAFEPNPATFDLLRQNLRRFGTRATAIPNALSTISGAGDFFITDDNPFNVTGGLSNREVEGREVHTVPIQCSDVRTLLGKRVDFLKLDVEGEEYNILRLPEISPDSITCMTVEVHDIPRRRGEFDSLMDSMKRRGYSVSGAGSDELPPTKECALIRFTPAGSQNDVH